MINKAILLYGEDWEGLYVNGLLVEEGHTLNEGYSRVKYFSDLAKKHNFMIEELAEQEICDEDNENAQEVGNFPKNIKDFVGNYEIEPKEYFGTI